MRAAAATRVRVATDRLACPGYPILDTDGILWERHGASWHTHGRIVVSEVPRHNADDFHQLLGLWLDRFEPQAKQLDSYRLTVTR